MNSIQKENVREIFLTVLSDNMKAIQLYEKYGFKDFGKTLDRWKGKMFESVIMKKVLNLKG